MSWISADPSSLPRIRYVITLDADTQMPRDAAGRLVGTLAHPLNRPRFDPAVGRVVAGYGVLQPQGQLPPDGGHALAVRRATGDLRRHRPLFDGGLRRLHGSVRRWGASRARGSTTSTPSRRPRARTFPENHILSHDLIEGNYARCGLLSDTELFDDFPARYHAYARREHRWVRGDWQLLPWLGRGVGVRSGRGPNRPRPDSPVSPPHSPLPTPPSQPLPLLERWKLLDNLRRSLVPPALLVLLVWAGRSCPAPPWLWTAMALASSALPFFQIVLGVVVACPRPVADPLKTSWDGVPSTFGQAGAGGASSWPIGPCCCWTRSGAPWCDCW